MPSVAQQLYVSAHDALRHGDQTIELRSRDVMTLVREHYALADALRQIKDWSEAYPLDVFPEPDFQRAAKVLSDAGLSLDRISASNMRHAIEGAGRIAKDALAAVEGEQ